MGSIPQKQCSKCKQYFPRTSEYFHTQKYADGFKASCKSCCQAMSTKWKQENAEYCKSYAHEYNDAHKEQRSLAFKDWRNRNYEYEIERQRKWRLENADYFRQWYIDHAEQQKAQGIAWREKHPERVKERGREYRAKHPQRVRIWCNENPEKIRLISSLRRARKHSLPNTLTIEQWQQILDHFNGCCAVCGRPQGFWHIIAMDHWIPLKANVPNNPGTVAWNVIPLCHGVDGCNNEKHAHMPLSWLIKKLGNKLGKIKYDEISEYQDRLKLQCDTVTILEQVQS